MEIIEVVSSKHKRDFLELPKRIYKNDFNWIQALDKDVEAIFDPEKNKLFKKGVCKRWLLLDDNNQVIGRVASFVNPKYKQKQPTGGIGFFEIIEDLKPLFFFLIIVVIG